MRILLIIAGCLLATFASAQPFQRVTVTRPANTTPYDIGDVIGGAIEITQTISKGGVLEINGIVATFSESAIPAGLAGITFHFFTAQPTVTDNAAFAISNTDLLTYIGSYAMTTAWVDQGSMCSAHINSIAFVAPDTNNSTVWVVPVTAGAWTPGSNSSIFGINFTVREKP